jgi:ADP-ribosyl-[dinitrogen reductase] hydrolase
VLKSMKLRTDAQNPPEIQATGWCVVRSLEVAPRSFYKTGSFEAVILKAANLGDDADTAAAVCGQIAGRFMANLKSPRNVETQGTCP